MFEQLEPKTRLRIVQLARMNGRKLRWIGAGMCVFAAVVPWLMILDLVETTFLLSLIVYGSMVLGMGLSFVGLLFDNYVDLSQ